jgi:hypothetical protein
LYAFYGGGGAGGIYSKGKGKTLIADLLKAEYFLEFHSNEGEGG